MPKSIPFFFNKNLTIHPCYGKLLAEIICVVLTKRIALIVNTIGIE